MLLHDAPPFTDRNRSPLREPATTMPGVCGMTRTSSASPPNGPVARQLQLAGWMKQAKIMSAQAERSASVVRACLRSVAGHAGNQCAMRPPNAILLFMNRYEPVCVHQPVKLTSYSLMLRRPKWLKLHLSNVTPYFF